jgi:hypothetical protein
VVGRAGSADLSAPIGDAPQPTSGSPSTTATSTSEPAPQPETVVRGDIEIVTPDIRPAPASTLSPIVGRATQPPAASRNLKSTSVTSASSPVNLRAAPDATSAVMPDATPASTPTPPPTAVVSPGPSDRPSTDRFVPVPAADAPENTEVRPTPTAPPTARPYSAIQTPTPTPIPPPMPTPAPTAIPRLDPTPRPTPGPTRST